MPAMSRVLSIALAGVLACSSHSTPAGPGGHGSAPPPPIDAPAAAQEPLDRDLPRLAERGVKLYEEVAQAFRAAGEDCAAAAAKVIELELRYRDVTAANRKVLHDGRARELKRALAPFEDRLDAAAKDLMQSAAMAKCSQDAAFSKAFDDLVGAPP
jgi:hypothetical protein